jgi:hypothetical protein
MRLWGTFQVQTITKRLRKSEDPVKLFPVSWHIEIWDNKCMFFYVARFVQFVMQQYAHLDSCNGHLILILLCSCFSWAYYQLMNGSNSSILSNLCHPTPYHSPIPIPINLCSIIQYFFILPKIIPTQKCDQRAKYTDGKPWSCKAKESALLSNPSLSSYLLARPPPPIWLPSLWEGTASFNYCLWAASVSLFHFF